MTRPGIESQSPEPLANTLPTKPTFKKENKNDEKVKLKYNAENFNSYQK